MDTFALVHDVSRFFRDDRYFCVQIKTLNGPRFALLRGITPVRFGMGEGAETFTDISADFGHVRLSEESEWIPVGAAGVEHATTARVDRTLSKEGE